MKRPKLVSAIVVGSTILGLGVKKTYDYSAAPSAAKESDFVFPLDGTQQDLPPIPVASRLPDFFQQTGGYTNDASHLNRTRIFGVARARSEEEVRAALAFARQHHLKIISAGEQHSMGGQSFTRDGIVLDLRELNRIDVDRSKHLVRVQSGARWWQVQKILDEQGLSVKSMQSINLFSIGGTLSVNAHGIDPDPGPVAPTVRSMRVMLASGEIVNASPTENEDLFRHVIGGYGLLGVILDAELEVVDNEMYLRHTQYMDFKQFPKFYEKEIESNKAIGLAFGRLSISPTSYLQETAFHVYSRTKFEGSLPTLEPARDTSLDRFVINFSKTGSFGRWTRWTLEKSVEPYLHTCVSRNQVMNGSEACLVSRNEEMYDDMAYLKNRLRDTDVLQEYFVPFDRMPEFVDKLREVVLRNGANLLNVTIRTVHRDSISALPYARSNMFAFVLYFNVKFNDRENDALRSTTRELIDASAQCDGTFYLPYQLYYSAEQLRVAYPNVDVFFATKRKYDPDVVFSNSFYEKYGASKS